MDFDVLHYTIDPSDIHGNTVAHRKQSFHCSRTRKASRFHDGDEHSVAFKTVQRKLRQATGCEKPAMDFSHPPYLHAGGAIVTDLQRPVIF